MHGGVVRSCSARPHSRAKDCSHCDKAERHYSTCEHLHMQGNLATLGGSKDETGVSLTATFGPQSLGNMKIGVTKDIST